MGKTKQKLWFDPKFPPVTPVYVGQKKPIYLVPEDTEDDDRLVEEDWEKTEWYFKIICIRQIKDSEGDDKTVVDVEWPNGYIDKDVPISSMYGHFVKLKRSELARFTEEYNSDDEYIEIDLSKDQTDEEKLQQLLKLLKYMSDNHDYLVEQSKKEEQERSVEVIEVTSVPPTLVEKVESDDEDNIKVETDGVEEIVEYVDEDGNPVDPDEEPLPIEITTDLVEEWFLPPAKGGFKIAQLREKATELGIENPKQYKKAELKQEFLNILE